jgi:hypothetical protein
VSRYRKVFIALVNSRQNLQPAVFKEQLTLMSRMLVWDDQNGSDIFE